MAERWPGAMLLTTAAEYLDCSRDVVEKLVREKQLSCIQFGTRGDRRILREDLDAWLATRRAQKVTP